MNEDAAMTDTRKVLILVIEDDMQIRRFLRASLASQGYKLLEAVNGEDGIRLAASHRPDLIVLDLGLPDIDGLTVARGIRKITTTPIIILSARGQERDKIDALDAGADDYVTKPFGVGELLARMRVALRHAARQGADSAEEPVFEVGDLHIDLVRRMVKRRGEEIHLTPIEYKILTTLVHHAGRVVTHRTLLQEVWGHTFADQTHYLRVYMQQLRKKLEETPAHPRYLRTEPGIGYRLAVE